MAKHDDAAALQAALDARFGDYAHLLGYGTSGAPVPMVEEV